MSRLWLKVPSFFKARLRRWILNPLLDRLGYIPPAKTNTEVLTKLLRSMHPAHTQFPLIRFGPLGDGGYLIPDDLEGVTACFSPGVGRISMFEEECAQRGMRIFMADRSVDGPSVQHPNFEFVDKFIGLLDTQEYITLDTWIDSSISENDGDLILQMDIEGAEWFALANVSHRNLLKFRIIVVELHDVDVLMHQQSFGVRAPVLERLLHNFICVHLHPNNCCGTVTIDGLELPRVLEMTLLRKDRSSVMGSCSQFPHPLDCDNTPEPSLVLPQSLYRQV